MIILSNDESKVLVNNDVGIFKNCGNDMINGS